MITSLRLLALSTLLGVCAVSAEALDQGMPQPKPLPAHLPGGPEKPLDILGLFTGMPCQTAVSVVQNILGDRQRVRQYTDNILQTGISWTHALVAIHDLIERGGSYSERFEIRCSGTGSGNQVLNIRRYLIYPDAAQVNLADLKRRLEDKYGKPNGPTSLAWVYEGGKNTPNALECPDSKDVAYPIDAENIACIFSLQVLVGRGLDEQRASTVTFDASDYLRVRETRKVDDEFKRAVTDWVNRNRPKSDAPKL